MWDRFSRRPGGRRSCYLSAVWARAWARALPASETLISGGGERQFVDQVSDAAFDVGANGAYGWGVEAGGVVEVVPAFVAFAGKMGQASPQPMVITTSAARTVRRSRGWGTRWRCRCLVQPWRRLRRGGPRVRVLTRRPHGRRSEPKRIRGPSETGRRCGCIRTGRSTCRRDVGLTLWRQLGGVGRRHRRRASLSIQLSDDGCRRLTDHDGGDLAAWPGPPIRRRRGC